jgi:hypothetical protein
VWQEERDKKHGLLYLSFTHGRNKNKIRPIKHNLICHDRYFLTINVTGIRKKA